MFGGTEVQGENRLTVEMASLNELQQQLQQLVAEKAETNNLIQELVADRLATQQ